MEGEARADKKKELDENEEKQRRCYDKYEYYRYSSMTRALYERDIKKSKIQTEKRICTERSENIVDGESNICFCENCVLRRKSEHKRWNAYVRTEGYSYYSVKDNRAKLHKLLCDWKSLPEEEKAKDN